MMNPRSPLAGMLLASGMVPLEQQGVEVLDTSDNNSNAAKAWLGGAVVFDQSLRGKVEVTGPEAALFLHNLCTNDIVGMPAVPVAKLFLPTRVRAPSLGPTFTMLF